MKKSQKRDLLKRITPIAGEAISRFGRDNKWTNVEISEYVGIPQNRLSEYINHEKNNRVISEKHLIMLTARGIIDVKNIKENLDLTDAEATFIDGIGTVESESLRGELFKAQRAGIDVEARIKKMRMAEQAGIDVDKLLEQALKEKEELG